jgi:hypothetical protein
MPAGNLYESTILVATSSGAPRAVVVPGRFAPNVLLNSTLVASGLVGDTIRIDTISGEITPGQPAIDGGSRIGSSNDYLIGGIPFFSIFHMETATTDPLPPESTFVCRGAPALTWYEELNRPGLGPFPLRRYVPGAGFQTISARVMPAGPASCTSQRAFMDVAEIWGTSRLTRFDVATGAVEELAPNVAAGQVWQVFGHEFLFQNPKDLMGDLLLFDERTHSIRPLGTRAAFLGAPVLRRGSIVVVGGTPDKPEVVAAHLDGSGIEKLGPGGQTMWTSPDGQRVLWSNGGDMDMETPQGPVTVDHFGARFVTSDTDASHILYTISVGTGAGTWAFALLP